MFDKIKSSIFTIFLLVIVSAEENMVFGSVIEICLSYYICSMFIVIIIFLLVLTIIAGICNSVIKFLILEMLDDVE